MSVRFGLALGATIVAVFALAMFGVAGLGAASTPIAKTNAGLGAAYLTSSCPANVTVAFGPSVVVAHTPMSVHVTVAFAPTDAASCSNGVQYQIHALPPGCTSAHTSSLVCTPTTAGTFHVQTTVTAQNTVISVVDTLVVV